MIALLREGSRVMLVLDCIDDYAAIAQFERAMAMARRGFICIKVPTLEDRDASPDHQG